MLNELALFYAGNPSAFVATALVIGLLVGSFLNVVIYRLPIILDREWRAQAAEFMPIENDAAPVSQTDKFTLSFPRSACPNCKAPISVWQNIPVASWLLLRGRCASCKSPISARYPLIELATALLSGWVAWHFGVGASALSGIVLTWTLIALTWIDIDHQLLPDSITLPLMWGGLLAAVTFGASAGQTLPVGPREAIIGAVAGYVSLWSVFQAFKLLTGKEGMGYGDFKLFAALGAWMGWKMLPLIIFLSAGAGAVLGVLMILLRGRDRATPMPFGPYLAISGWLAMLYGKDLINGYLRVSGLTH